MKNYYAVSNIPINFQFYLQLLCFEVLLIYNYCLQVKRRLDQWNVSIPIKRLRGSISHIVVQNGRVLIISAA